MKHLITTLFLSALPVTAAADISDMIAAQGLAATEADLAAREAPSGTERMGLAATRFLRGIETAWQARYRVGATQGIAPLPVLSSELPENPNPAPFEPGFINDLFAALAVSMEGARAPLEAPLGTDDALVLRLEDLWLDVDQNGQRDEDEGLENLAAAALGMWSDFEGAEIRFDAADAAWLSAYTHLIGAVAELVLAFDPQPEIARMIDTRAALAAQWDSIDPETYRPSRGFESYADLAQVMLSTLRHQPDPARVTAAAGHLREMLAQNRRFWQDLAAETDHDREWIPNDAQQAALGFELPPGTGPAWLAVLADGEKLLDGARLIPHWRFAPGHGIDLSAWIAAPTPLDAAGWISGADAMGFAAEGPLVDARALEQFENLIGGNGPLYMLLLN